MVFPFPSKVTSPIFANLSVLVIIEYPFSEKPNLSAAASLLLNVSELEASSPDLMAVLGWPNLFLASGLVPFGSLLCSANNPAAYFISS